jgi:hypothetical protein
VFLLYISYVLLGCLTLCNKILLTYQKKKKKKFSCLLHVFSGFKVFPSSFSIKAALGNLRMSDDSLPSNHMYFWACDMRNPGGSSFVEVHSLSQLLGFFLFIFI